MTAVIRDPIVMFGTGRCGSTLLHDVVSTHPQVAWLSRLNDVFPRRPRVSAALMHGIDFPVAGALLRRRFPPAEPYAFYDRFHAGISESYRDLTEHDIHSKTTQKLQEAWAGALTRKRSRLLVKFTGWSRLGMVNRLLPGAKYIHVVRDPRAVAYSMLRVSFWKGWQGPTKWRYGPLNKKHEAIWKRSEGSFAVLAAIEWDIVMGAAEVAIEKLGSERVAQITYEDLCADPGPRVQEILGFCGLNGSSTDLLKGFDIQSQNAGWKSALTTLDLDLIEELLSTRMASYGYLPR